MDNLEELLRALAEDDEPSGEENSRSESCTEDKSASGGLFANLDPEMLIKLLGLFETLNQPDDNERFLLALKPLLREENRVKIDSALRLMKLISLLPLLKSSGIMDTLGKLL